jgi:hypothetical protein
MIAERQEVTHGTVHSERKAESKGSQRVTHCSSYASWAFVDYQLHSPLANRCSETVDYSILLCRTPGRRGGGAESPLSESPQPDIIPSYVQSVVIQIRVKKWVS